MCISQNFLEHRKCFLFKLCARLVEKEREREGKRERKNDSRVAETEINWQKHLLWRKTISISAFLEHTIRHSPLFANQAGKSIQRNVTG